MNKEKLILQLLELFRRYGYEGATLSKISQFTGLGKASLYHHFPGGKEDMVNAVLEYSENWLEEKILKPMRAQNNPSDRLKEMCARVNELYQGGEQCCLLGVLLLGEARDLFHEKIKNSLKLWIEAIAEVLVEAGIEEQIAREQAEDAIASIQGALILARGLDDLEPFQRTLRQIKELCYKL
ncbi:MAG: TetR/AcrR family transcriptional regulator [Pleurocapsa sp. SU_5_0]|nr:TetR/AcrR family transcriptional regulator [Pleurocapsa sp. SU_5_0]NJO94765.1 TetR/AcrR family transcriptional regulator [Pleurocapsa sp. CRU_1_2]NJR46713.1 TetR/AcrR family transcriptional regulator [Hyellaceae cyanobacterium CSU_1_1]